MPTKIVASPTSTLEEGVEATLRLVADPALEGVSGRYFDGLREARAGPAGRRRRRAAPAARAVRAAQRSGSLSAGRADCRRASMRSRRAIRASSDGCVAGSAAGRERRQQVERVARGGGAQVARRDRHARRRRPSSARRRAPRDGRSARRRRRRRRTRGSATARACRGRDPADRRRDQAAELQRPEAARRSDGTPPPSSAAPGPPTTVMTVGVAVGDVRELVRDHGLELARLEPVEQRPA